MNEIARERAVSPRTALRLANFTGDSFFLVVNLATWEVWRITARPGNAFRGDASTLTDEYLYLGENDYSERANHEIRRVLRLRLAELDSYATPL